MTAAARRPASPYARRLARERGFALELISGTGPGGRIVAADVEAFAGKRAAEASRPAPAVGSVSAYGCAIDLSRLQKLLADFGGDRVSLDLDAMLVRAAALALEAVPAANRLPGDDSEAPQIAVAWESGGADTRRLVLLPDAHLGLASRLHDRLANPDAAAVTSGRAALSLRRIAQSGIRPTAMPLLPGFALRLVVTPSAGAAASEALLCFDAGLVGEDDAAAFLARFRDGLETPLTLLA